MNQLWINGNIIDSQKDGHIHCGDRGFNYGDGLFATMRIKDAQVLFLAEHIERLAQGAMRLGINWSLSSETIEAMAVATQRYPNACLKLVITRGVGGRGYTPSVDIKPTEVLTVQDLPAHYLEWQQKGISLATSDVKLAKQPRLAGIKHLNRLEQVLIKSQPLPGWADDFLVLDSDSGVVEASMANVFAMFDQRIITPAITHSGVAGVMRTQAIKVLIESGYNVHIAPLSIEECLNADHLFLTNSLFGVIGVNRFEQCHYSSNQLVVRLQQLLNVTL